MLKSKYIRFLSVFSVLGFALLMQTAFAEGDTGLGGIATSVTGSFTAFGKLMVAAAYVAGFALTIAAIFKFKAHKDNPQQVPMGTPIALLAIGIVLVFLPSLFAPAGQTAFGDEGGTGGGFGGEGATKVPGGGDGGDPPPA